MIRNYSPFSLEKTLEVNIWVGGWVSGGSVEDGGGGWVGIVH